MLQTGIETKNAKNVIRILYKQYSNTFLFNIPILACSSIRLQL